MAHTLKAYYYTDPTTAVTVDFMGAIATNTGIALDSYQMGIPGIEQVRNNSLYSDYPRQVYSKHDTVTDTLTVTVRGSTNTALYTNLHLLAKLGEYARLSRTSLTSTLSAYLELKPGGSAAGEVLYAPILDCRVELPADWANNQDATLMVEDVTVTIERGMWAKHSPNIDPRTADSGFGLTDQPRLGSSSSASVGGDTSALWNLVILSEDDTTHPAIDKIIIGYASLAKHGAKYSAYGVQEAESQTNGTDTADAADVTASNGNKVVCTFATVATAADRVTKASGTGPGVFRIFARMKITGTAKASVYVKITESYGGPYVGTAVSVETTTWAIYDLGIVRAYQNNWFASLGNLSSVAALALTASLTSGTGDLEIDYFHIMPTEGYITMSALEIAVNGPFPYISIGNIGMTTPNLLVQTSNAAGIGPRSSSPGWTASLEPLPGLAYVYWMVGTDTAGVFDVGLTGNIKISFKLSARYIMPSLV